MASNTPRAEAWLTLVDAWCAKHGITRTQGLSILFEDISESGPCPNRRYIMWPDAEDLYYQIDNANKGG